MIKNNWTVCYAAEQLIDKRLLIDCRWPSALPEKSGEFYASILGQRVHSRLPAVLKSKVIRETDLCWCPLIIVPDPGYFFKTGSYFSKRSDCIFFLIVETSINFLNFNHFEGQKINVPAIIFSNLVNM